MPRQRHCIYALTHPSLPNHSYSNAGIRTTQIDSRRVHHGLRDEQSIKARSTIRRLTQYRRSLGFEYRG